MADIAREIAFDNTAPSGERTAALGELQQDYMPASADIIHGAFLREAIEAVRNTWEEQSALMTKAIPANDLVDFPSRAAELKIPGMQSVRVDDRIISTNGGYWERPGILSFDALNAMVDQTPVLSAILMTRVRQVQRFCGVAEGGQDRPGFDIRHIDRMHQLTKSESESIDLLKRFFVNCGWEFNPRRRKSLKRDAFAQMMAKATRDSLTLDSVGLELEWKRDKSLGFDGFYCVDGSTIRLTPEEGYEDNPDVFALQVVGGRISTAYTYNDLIYEPRNPRSSVRAAGYGLSECDLLIRVVTGFLNAMTYNLKGFDSNAIPKGMLHLTGNYSQKDLDAFKRYWTAMVKGADKVWSLPVMVSKDQESKASFERFGVDFNEMYFAKWMTFLVSMACAVYGISPAEINFDSFSGGNSSPLSGSDTEEKLAASKDSGLRPVLSYFENLLTDYILADYSDKYVFRWTGLDPEDADKKHEIRKMIMTVNELRAEEGHQALPGPIGDAPVNPSLTGVWMQLRQEAQQAAAPEKAGDGKGDFGDGDPDGAEAGDFGQAGVDRGGGPGDQAGDQEGQPDFGEASRSGTGNFGQELQKSISEIYEFCL